MTDPDLTAGQLIASMEAKASDLKSRRSKVETRLNGTMRELEILDREIAQIQAGLISVRSFAGSDDPGDTQIAGMSIADACEAIIRDRGGETTVADIVATLRTTGKLKEAGRRSNYNTVASQMYRAKGRFEKVEGSVGKWRLAPPSVRIFEPGPNSSELVWAPIDSDIDGPDNIDLDEAFGDAPLGP